MYFWYLHLYQEAPRRAILEMASLPPLFRGWLNITDKKAKFVLCQTLIWKYETVYVDYDIKSNTTQDINEFY